MARYIDADLIKNIELIPYKRGSENINAIIANMAIVGAKQLVDNIPTADVQLVVHAHWERIWIKYSQGYYCTNCNAQVAPSFHEYAYCPNCGAKMDEAVE